MEGSSRFSLNAADLKKIGVGALLAMGGALVVYLSTEVVPTIDQSTALGALLAGVASIALNTFRKLLSDTRAESTNQP